MMNNELNLEVGGQYSKKDLAELIDAPALLKLREGIYNSSDTTNTLLFVTLDKSDREENIQYNDYFEDEYFHWDSQNRQHIKTPRIKEMVNGLRNIHLFVRIKAEDEEGKTLPFVYCGELEYEDYEKGTANPVHIIFRSLDYDDFTDDDSILKAIYQWNPSKKGIKPAYKIENKKQISERRKKNYKKPNETERKGLVTSRVGQGYYRNFIIEKWNAKCPVTGCNVLNILIASHILPWSDSNDEERLDLDNGILLSPNVDALFDRHLISFEDDGQMIISDKITEETLKKLGIKPDSIITVSEGMKRYLAIHRKSLYEKD